MILGKTPPPKVPLDGRQPQNFPEWLEVATWNLVPSAKERVRPEIEAHYAEAVQSHLALGDSEATALADLGDANASAKRFNLQHLTIQEVAALRKQITDAQGSNLTIPRLAILFCGSITSLILLIGWVFGLSTNTRHFYAFDLPMLLFYLFFASLDLVAIVLARRKTTLGLARRFSLLGTIKKLNMQFMMVVLFYFMLMDAGPDKLLSDSSYYSYFMNMAIPLLIVMNLMGMVKDSRADAHVRKKLAAATEDDLPPSDLTSA